MWKKIVTSFFALIVIFSFSTVGYGTSMDKVNRYQVKAPEEGSLFTEKVTVVSGRAPKGTDIVIEVYGTADLTGKNYTLTRLPKEGDYVRISSELIKSGELGFAKEVKLVTGINKIVVIFKVNGGAPSVGRIVYVYDKEVAKESAGSPSLVGTPRK